MARLGKVMHGRCTKLQSKAPQGEKEGRWPLWAGWSEEAVWEDAVEGRWHRGTLLFYGGSWVSLWAALSLDLDDMWLWPSLTL